MLYIEVKYFLRFHAFLHTTSKLTQHLLCIVRADPRPQVREGETVFGVERPVVGWRFGRVVWPRGFHVFFLFFVMLHIRLDFMFQTVFL